MSKTITIPPCRNPFVVIVNGIRYEYESGKEIEVPDEVAEVIQFHVDSKPKAKPIVPGDSDGAYDAGYAAGKQAEYDTFWDEYQQNGTRTSYEHAFMGPGWTDVSYNPKYPIVAKNAYSMYSNSRITEVLNIDTSGATSAVSIFYNTSAERIGTVSFEATVALQTTFNNSRKLHTIERVILTAANTYTNPFNNCTALENLTIEGTIGQNGFNVQWSTKLTHDSLMSIINALKDYSADTSGTTYTVTLGTENIAKLTEEELAIAYLKGWDVI